MQLQTSSVGAGGARPCFGPRLRPTLALRPFARARAHKDDEPGASERSYEDLFKDEIARRGLNGGGVTSSSPAGTTSSRNRTGSSSSSQSSNPFQQPTPRGSIPGSRSREGPSSGDVDRESGQRERSIAMVNEGLEGLIPRASQLLQLGGSVFLAFAPFILAISLLFSGIYFVFGDSFVHGGQVGKGLPAYIDAEALLAEPTVDPRIPYM